MRADAIPFVGHGQSDNAEREGWKKPSGHSTGQHLKQATFFPTSWPYASKTARIPVMKIPSNRPAPPMEAMGAPSS